MVYVMSDLHGRYDLYRKMLEKIRLGADDTLYVLGDFVDRGPDGVKILLDVMNRPNVKPLIGNHDWTMASLIGSEAQLAAEFGRGDIAELYRLWFLDGGNPTYRAVRALDPPMRMALLQFIDDMDFIAEITVNGRKFFLSHTLPEFDRSMPLTDHPADDFIHGETDYDNVYLPDTVTVTGHTPTGLISPDYRGRIWQGNQHIAVDCGAVFFGTLGCICLDTMEEFYVKGEETK